MALLRNRARWPVAILSLVSCAALLTLVHNYRPAATGLWLETFYNSVHVLVFAFIAPALFLVFRTLSKLRFLYCLLAAGGIAILLGLLSEVAQIEGPRDASFEDLLANWLGAISGLLLVVAWWHRKHGRSRHQIVWGIAGLALIIVALRSLILVSAAYVERCIALPPLFQIESRFGNAFLRKQHATLEKTWSPTDQRLVGRIVLGEGRWPGLVFHDIWPDWSDYAVLAFDLELDESEPLTIHIRVHDYAHKHGRQPYRDRFNNTYLLQPGNQTIRIPLEEIKNAPANRSIDMTKIETLVIFATRADSGRSFNLVEIRLEQ